MAESEVIRNKQEWDRIHTLAERRHVAATVLAFFTSRRPDKPMDPVLEDMFANLVLEADDRQYAIFWERILADKEQIVPKLLAELDGTPPKERSEAEKLSEGELDSLASRKANAAVTLLRLKIEIERHEKATAAATLLRLMITDDMVWKLLQHREDPSVRTYIVHRLMPYGVPVQVVVDRLLDGNPEISETRALILSLGEYPPGSPGRSSLPEEWRKKRQRFVNAPERRLCQQSGRRNP